MTFSKTMDYRDGYIQASIVFCNDDQDEMDAFQEAMVDAYNFGLKILLITLPRYGGSVITVQLTEDCSEFEFDTLFPKAKELGWKKPGGD